MAQAWFNQFAGGWAAASSCGTMPALLPDPLTIRVLDEIGVETRLLLPKPVNNTLLSRADIVILMGKDVFRGAFTPDYVWDFQDPTGRDIAHYRIQRDALRCRVQELIVELQRNHFKSTDSDWIHPALLERELFTQHMLGS
jgi:protein-tyrosine-phosphatase